MRRLYVLLGDPVAHSRSPALMARAFALLSVDAVYAPCRVPAEQLATAVRGLRVLGVSGFNVTVPHKAQALELCNRVSHAAGRIGAVNCVARVGDELYGDNTDAPGLLRALRANGVDLAGSAGDRTVVVGAGGSARAAAVALSGQARHVSVLNRTGAKARAVAQVLRSGGATVEYAASGSEEARALLARASLIVHCTTVGMGTADLPLDVAQLPSGCAVVDLVYAGAPGTAPGETALVLAARARGLCAVDGVDVLVHQAIASLELWLQLPQLDYLAPELRAAALATAHSPQPTAQVTPGQLAEAGSRKPEAEVTQVTPEPRS